MFYLIPYKGRVPIYPVSSPNGTRLQQGSCLYTCPLDVRYMSGICPVYVRYRSGQVPDIYRTSTGQQLEENGGYTEAIIWIEWR